MQQRGSHPELATVLRTGPFHLALRTALQARGLALHRVQQHLAQRGIHVGVTSLSYWQQGRRRPERPESLRAVRALEEVLDLPAHSLTRLLGPRQALAAGSAAVATRPYRDLISPASAMDELLAELPGPRDTGLHTVTHIERIRLGPDRQLLRRDSQHALRAHRDGIDRYLAIYQGDPGCDVQRVAIRAEENCRPGRIRRDQASQLVVAELLLDRRLRTGETHLLSYGFDDAPSPAPTHEYVRGFNSGAGQYVLQVTFHPDALPVRCHRFASRAPGAIPFESEELTLDGHGCVHLVAGGLAPCLLGVGWDWE
ncbi:helix-turn-helix domain-containing protein [Kitasatospora mediocidica]|uniref:helix-turn-helix domain-containing protein n=1 Tax=Kitasatospora mediocidica TaxID=58352 RepID=UPI0005646EFE|nr:helix-turn-helix transcriptional regulator [Kitasatospora mediocidica]